MIPIARGSEPEELRAARRKYLAKAFLAYLDGREFDFSGYDCVKRELYERQHGKCAYCERNTGISSQPVEHFRPKDGALRTLRGEIEIWDKERYWWLAWTWDNLFFSCATCNGGSNKGNRFPLFAGAPPLPSPPRAESPEVPAECFDVSREASLLIDPAREDPLEHIRWRPINAAAGVPEDRLVWTPMHRTKRGDVTIRVLGLRGELSDHVGRHIRTCVWPRVRTLRAQISLGRADLVRSEWDAMTRDLMAPDALYVAASHDALDYFVPSATRLNWRLHLPRPGAPQGPSPAGDLPEPDGFQHLPVRLRWRIRADDEPLKALVLDVCRVQSWSVDELVLLFDRSTQYMSTLIREWVAEGGLEEVPGASPRRFRVPPPSPAP